MELFSGLSETIIRFGIFAAILLTFAVVEILTPRRRLHWPKGRRWATNFAIAAIATLVVRLMGALAIPLVAVASAVYAEEHGWGLLNNVGWPGWLEFAVALVILDFAIWLQHYASHKVPLFWRVHRVHHTDVDIDVSTAIRFHPIEIALSMLWKILLVLCFGFSAIAVIAFEAILNGCAMFNHANIALPSPLDRVLRAVIVTPDMHRVHHSVLRREHDSNFGFNLSIWDRLFGTYTAQPERGHEGMTIGLEDYQSPRPTRFLWSLALPFLSRSGRR
jgi:sterol desaturase/sphingolipid hydroxylase (fatty acid hydroxylase superfamily)